MLDIVHSYFINWIYTNDHDQDKPIWIAGAIFFFIIFQRDFVTLSETENEVRSGHYS